MKSRLFRRAAAGLAACVLTVSAMAPLHFSVSAAENLITNSTFENGSADWGIYKESGGSARMLAQDGQLALHISSTGKVSYAVQMYYDIIPLYQNGVYHLEYDISSSVDRFVEGMIQQNGGTYQAYTWKGLDLTSTPQHVSYDFTMEAESDIMAKMVFNCGLQEKDGGDLGEHVIYLDNVVLELIDDTNVDYSSVRPYEPPIVASQVGYRPDDRKTAVVRGTGTAYDTLYVINYDTGSVAATVPLSAQTNYAAGNEDVKTADFSSVTAPGRYILSVDPPERDQQDTDHSYSFEIKEDAFTSLTDETVKMLYMQRCGTAVEGGAFSHPACHTGMATVYGTGEQIDVSGGWHDAGDYGRYVVPGAKTIADILYAYLDAPETFSDSTGIPESGNGIPDIVDEAAYELDWMFKMQADNGGVYHKVTCESFPGYVAPQLETEPLIVTPVSTTATADFAGAMALAAEVFKPFNPDYANKCLTAAEKAYAFLEQNPNLIFTNPVDITTGEYGDKSDTDERYWATAQLFRTTNNDKYYEDLTSMGASTGMDWALMGDYGNIALLTMKNADATEGYYEGAKSAILSQAKTMLSASKSSPYGAAVRKFNWGSNMTIANAGVILDLAYRLTGEQEYLDAANAQRDYLLGMNPLGECFVTGFGTVSPQTPHHRPSMAAGQAMPGMLVGGVNSALEDSAAKAYLKGVAPAKCYVDNSESYSTNEITIYWNSPLTYLLTLTENNEKETPDLILGDLNGDQKVNGFDTALLRQAIMNNEKPDAGDVNQDQAVDVSDLVMHQQWVLGKIQHFGSMITPPAPKDPDTPDNPATGNTTPSGITDFGTAPDSTADKFADFRQGTSPLFIASNGWTNGNPFDCGWYADKAVVNNGCLSLTIDKDNTGKYHYAAAEYRTNDFYGYGYYETSMQAIKNPGVVSSFFTYTGPSDNNPWDEIDIEVLGKDTTKVQFNYFTNSKGDHEYLYDLGFDASEGYHTYGFDWQPNSITWYVDGKAVHTATENIPSTPGKIMMNVWPGTGVDSWLAPFDGTTPLTARYQWVTYKNK